MHLPVLLNTFAKGKYKGKCGPTNQKKSYIIIFVKYFILLFNILIISILLLCIIQLVTNRL